MPQMRFQPARLSRPTRHQQTARDGGDARRSTHNPATTARGLDPAGRPSWACECLRVCLHFGLRYIMAAPMRQPNAAVEVSVRMRFHADHLASLKRWRTAGRSPMRAGSPAALIASLSGTLTAMVMITAMRYKTNAAPIHGSALRLSPP